LQVREEEGRTREAAALQGNRKKEARARVAG
jgi:hypothetical protein